MSLDDAISYFTRKGRKQISNLTVNTSVENHVFSCLNLSLVPLSCQIQREKKELFNELATAGLTRHMN